MSTTTTAEDNPRGGGGGDNSTSNNGESVAGVFECNICLEDASQPVITMCGHLYCWPCIYRWMRMHSNNPMCPVCKSMVSTDKLIPLYGRGKEQTDPRTRPPEDDIPNRPAGHAEPAPQRSSFHPFHTPNNNNNNNAFTYGGISFGAGFGLFPSLFGLQFQAFPQGTGGYFNLPADQEPPQGLLSRVLFILAIFVLFFLIFF